MNEHPGVRPVVIEPQQHAVPPARTLSRGARDMPVGLSANSIGLGDAGTLNIRRLLFIGVPATVLLAVAFGTWLVVRSLAPLSLQTVSNSVYEYSFLFYKNSETINLVAGEGLKYEDKALVIAKPTSDPVTNKCQEVGDGWQEVARVPVEGVEHPICRLHDDVFLVTFYHGKERHLLEVTYTTPHAANVADVQQIARSIKVTLP